MRDIEVDKQPELVSTQLEIRQQLRGMNRQQLLYGFDLDDQAVFHDEIDAVSKANLNPSINNWQPHLVLELQPSLRELVIQARIVCALEQAGTECGMNVQGGGNNSVGGFVRTQNESFPLCPWCPLW